MSITRIDPGRRFAEAVVHGDTVYLAGHVGSDPDAGVYEQTRDILAQIDAHLAAAGTDKSKLLMVNVWLVDIGDVRRDEPGLGRVAGPATTCRRARPSRPAWRRRTTRWRSRRSPPGSARAYSKKPPAA